ncbi:MAG: hypothetical protein HYZ75_16700 [Elusimicrobia bacterium]|nr:hypothetical protein [Elusimicrobiota bacterium]
MRLLLALLTAWPAPVFAEAASALNQLFASQTIMTGAVAGGAEASAAASRRAFAESSGAGAVRLGGRGGRSFAAELPPIAPSAAPTARAAPLRAAYAAKEEEKDKKGGWDYNGTMKAAGFGLAGALIGFALGGPIGAAAGFLAGFFIGALLWSMGGKR